MLGEVLGVERRRRWNDDEKLEIVLEVGVGGSSVTQVAQRHEITRSQIYGWRRDLKKKGLWSPDRGAVFLPVDFGPHSEPAQSPAPSRPVLVELRLSNGRCLRFDSSMDGEALTRLIRAVEAARSVLAPGFGFIWPAARPTCGRELPVSRPWPRTCCVRSPPAAPSSRSGDARATGSSCSTGMARASASTTRSSSAGAFHGRTPRPESRG